MLKTLFLLLSFLPILCTSKLQNIFLSSKIIDKNTQEIKIHITVQQKDFFYKDYINFSVDHPDVRLSEWKTNINPVLHYDQLFKETKLIYNKNFIITLTLTYQKITSEKKHLYFSYYQHSERKIKQKLFLLPDFIAPKKQHDETNATTHQKLYPKKYEFSHNFLEPLIEIIHIKWILRVVAFIAIFSVCIFCCTLLLFSAQLKPFSNSLPLIQNVLYIVCYIAGMILLLFLLNMSLIKSISYLISYEKFFTYVLVFIHLYLAFFLHNQNTQKLYLFEVLKKKNIKSYSVHALISSVLASLYYSLIILPSLYIFNSFLRSSIIASVFVLVICISLSSNALYFFMKKNIKKNMMKDFFSLSTLLGSFTFAYLGLVYAQNVLPTYASRCILVFFISCVGYTFIKKGTKFTTYKLRTISIFLGCFFISTTVLLFFWLIQEIDTFISAF